MAYSRVIIAGGRDFNDINKMKSYLMELVNQELIDDSTVLICGEARGADSLGKSIWVSAGMPVESYPADWNTYGKRAGYIRNEQMGEVADAVIAFWDGSSRGTKHMIDIMQRKNKPTHICYY